MSNNSDDFFGGFFDFNGDGKTDLGEEWIAYKILEDIEKSDGDDSEPYCSFGDFVNIPAPISTPVEEAPVDDKQQTTEEIIDYATYKKRKNGFLRDLWLSIIVCAPFTVIPIGLLYGAVSVYDENDSPSLAVFLLFIGIAGFIAYAIIKAFLSLAKRDIDGINNLNMQFQETASPEEQAKLSLRNKRINVVCICLALCLFVGLVVLGAINSTNYKSVYNEAVIEIRAGNYEQAKSMLEKIGDKQYKSTDSLISLCDACYHYEHNQKLLAYYDMKNVHLDGLTEQEQKKLDDFTDELSAEYQHHFYSSYSSIVSGKYSGRTPAMTKEEADRLRGTGYHGTRPGSEAENIELQAAQVKCKKCGYHSDNGANSLCDLCQSEEKNTTNKTVTNNKQTTKPYSNKTYSKSKKDDDDPYDAKSYRNEEDFYYDHYYDFFDYYDAEKYYREHND